MATVTALRASGRDRVAVDLDGAAWRVLPLEAVVRAGLGVGSQLGRAQARTLARERRRLAALNVATRTLRHRSLSKRGLDERLRRRGIAPSTRRRTIETLQGAGFVDDERFALRRAETLADRGYGDAFIRDDLERNGLDYDAADEAVQALDPELVRAAAELERRGCDARALRALQRRGFSEEAIEGAVARHGPSELG